MSPDLDGLRAAGLAHDLNNVLAAIDATAAEMLAAADAQTIGGLAEIRRYVGRGAALVAALIGTAPASSSHADAVQPLCIAEAIAECAPLLERLAGPNVALDIDMGAPGMAARIDALALERVLANLVVNARDAMPGGGTITLRITHAGSTVAIEVGDTGGGIAPDRHEAVFAPFVTTKPGRSGGAGLGLPTVRQIVRAVGGEIALDSAPGAGARFTVSLPLVAETAIPARLGTVLLVEDEDTIRRMAARALRQAGWEVQAVDSAEAAFAALDAAALEPAGGPFALVICDLSLPCGDGFTVVARARIAHPGLPAILVSGYADAQLRQECADRDIRFVAKPFAASGLLAAADACMRVVVVRKGENI